MDPGLFFRTGPICHRGKGVQFWDLKQKSFIFNRNYILSLIATRASQFLPMFWGVLGSKIDPLPDPTPPKTGKIGRGGPTESRWNSSLQSRTNRNRSVRLFEEIGRAHV